jgi:hypothetical protein
MSGARLLPLALAGLLGCHANPSVELRPIGAPCHADADCGSGPAPRCATDHPGGYCEAACNHDRDCPDGAVCVGGGSISKGDCHRRCDGPAANGCRTAAGYRCIAAGDDASHEYCDPPGRSEMARRLRGRSWRW